MSKQQPVQETNKPHKMARPPMVQETGLLLEPEPFDFLLQRAEFVPHLVTSGEAARLQRTIGNQAVGQLDRGYSHNQTVNGGANANVAQVSFQHILDNRNRVVNGVLGGERPFPPHVPRSIQRTPKETRSGTRQPATEVPALSQQTVSDARANLTSDQQAAINTVVQDLVAQGQINLAYLQGAAMAYVNSSQLPAGHYGHTSLTPGSGHPRPCRVIIGPDALQSVGLLYTTIMHEYQHVLQFRSGPARGRGEATDEVEARLWEVEHLEQSGLWRDIRYMTELPGQLRHWWNQLSADQQTPLIVRRHAAQATLQTMNQRRLAAQFRQQTGRAPAE